MLPRVTTRMNNPIPAEIRAAREAAGLTQQEAGELIHGSRRAWQDYESGARKMHPGLWELFQAKANETEEEMTIAETVVAQSYENGEMGYYARLSDRYLRSLGGRLVASSNDGESIVSCSPTDTWEFPDGSRAIIGYAVADVA